MQTNRSLNSIRHSGSLQHVKDASSPIPTILQLCTIDSKSFQKRPICPTTHTCASRYCLLLQLHVCLRGQLSTTVDTKRGDQEHHLSGQGRPLRLQPPDPRICAVFPILPVTMLTKMKVCVDYAEGYQAVHTTFQVVWTRVRLSPTYAGSSPATTPTGPQAG
ncbi:MAG: hypothetical protein J3R72DRAFT_14196 [Linnemannia gamsii]|nr:MAG: hypothetical protein J3R72DRAFT_14196 [Linnemannia gamsii]